MTIHTDTLYLGDNGRCYCGEHLGSTARATGRDLSGQKILPVAGDVLEECRALGFTLRCEEPRCTRTA